MCPAYSFASGFGIHPQNVSAAVCRFAERHTRLLNAYIRRSHALLEGSLAPLMRVHKLIDFDNKRLWFRTKVRQSDSRPYGGSLRVNVRLVGGWLDGTRAGSVGKDGVCVRVE